MKKKATDDLQQELTASTDLRYFLAENQEQFVHKEFSERLLELFNRSGMSKSVLARKAGTSEVYLYQLFSGERTPSRDRALCLCFGLQTSLEETQNLLRNCGLAQLYPKKRRDAIVIYGLAHHMDLDQVNDCLFEEGEATLC